MAFRIGLLGFSSFFRPLFVRKVADKSLFIGYLLVRTPRGETTGDYICVRPKAVKILCLYFLLVL